MISSAMAVLKRLSQKATSVVPTAGHPWSPVEAILRAAKMQSRQSEVRLSKLLDRSDRILKPLRDPLRVNTGLNRWLADDREEAYSDWLQWVLKEIDDGEQVLRLLGIWSPRLAKRCRGTSYEVEREFSVPPYGRLDIVVRFDQDLLIVIEVKKTQADIAETEKHTGYCEWIGQQPARTTFPLLLAVGESSEEDCYGFTPLSWEKLCIGLRLQLPGVVKRCDLATAAMFVAFISAVETNLLHFVPPGRGAHGRSLLFTRTAAHIEQSLNPKLGAKSEKL
jgi:hypothetical protein